MSLSEVKIGIIAMGTSGISLATRLATEGLQVISYFSSKDHLVSKESESLTVIDLPSKKLQHPSGLRISTDTQDVIQNSNVILLVTPTPPNPDGSLSLTQLLPLCDQIGASLVSRSEKVIVVICSTVYPGSTGGAIKSTIERASQKLINKDFGLVYCPSLLASSITGKPVVIGESDAASGLMIEKIIRKIEKHGLSLQRMNLVNAEIARLALGSISSMKSAFSAMIARICEKIPYADVEMVTRALGEDFLGASNPFSIGVESNSSSNPNENRALECLADNVGIEPTLPRAAVKACADQITLLAKLAKSKVSPNGRVGILGLSWKDENGQIVESQGAALVKKLLDLNVPVTIYDPSGYHLDPKYRGKEIVPTTSTRECCEKSDVLVIAAPWRCFSALNYLLEHATSPKTIIDCWKLLDKKKMSRAMTYITLGAGNRGITISTSANAEGEHAGAVKHDGTRFKAQFVE